MARNKWHLLLFLSRDISRDCWVEERIMRDKLYYFRGRRLHQDVVLDITVYTIFAFVRALKAPPRIIFLMNAKCCVISQCFLCKRSRRSDSVTRRSNDNYSTSEYTWHLNDARRELSRNERRYFAVASHK